MIFSLSFFLILRRRTNVLAHVTRRLTDDHRAMFRFVLLQNETTSIEGEYEPRKRCQNRISRLVSSRFLF